MDDHELLTDGELLALTVAGDAAAFGAFYRRYEIALLGWLRRRVGTPDLAMDLAYEVFATLLEAADRFDPIRAGGDWASVWVFSTAQKALAESVRRGRVADGARRRMGFDGPLVVSDGVRATVDRIADVSGDELVRAMLAELPPARRAEVIARIFRDDTLADATRGMRSSGLVVGDRFHVHDSDSQAPAPTRAGGALRTRLGWALRTPTRTMQRRARGASESRPAQLLPALEALLTRAAASRWREGDESR